MHIFPARMDVAGWRVLRRAVGDDQAMIDFWRQFVPVYRQFEHSHRVPLVHVDKKRWRYQIDRVTHRPE